MHWGMRPGSAIGNKYKVVKVLRKNPRTRRTYCVIQHVPHSVSVRQRAGKLGFTLCNNMHKGVQAELTRLSASQIPFGMYPVNTCQAADTQTGFHRKHLSQK